MTQQVPQPTAQFSLPARPRADGSYVASIKTASGKWRDVRIPRSVAVAPNYKAAEKWIMRHLAQLAAGARPSDLVSNAVSATPGTRVRDLAPKVIDYRKLEKLSPATKHEFESNMRTHVVPFFGDRLAHELGSDDFLTFRDHLVGLGRDPLTIRSVFKNLGLFFQTAIARKLDAELVRVGNPLRAAYANGLLKMPEPKDKPTVYVPQPDAERLVSCPDIPEHRRVRYLLAFLSGLRDGEIAGLVWDDIDLDADVPTLKVRGAVAVPREPKAQLEKGDTKNASSKRTIPLHSQLLPALAAWKDTGWVRWVGWEPRGADPVFPDDGGQLYRPRSADLIRDDLATVGCATRCDGEPIDFHATRRSFSTWLEDAGVYPETIDRLLGHKGKSVRERHYSAATMRPMKDAIERIRLDLGVYDTPSSGDANGSNGDPSVGNGVGLSENVSETGSAGPFPSDAGECASEPDSSNDAAVDDRPTVSATTRTDPSRFPKPWVVRSNRIGGANVASCGPLIPVFEPGRCGIP